MLRAVTVAEGITPCRSSVTIPEIAPEVACALAFQAALTMTVSSRARSRIVLVINLASEVIGMVEKTIFWIVSP
jgi:hypothetical protein